MQEDRIRVVITGLGAVAAPGLGREVLWQAALKRQSYVRSITRFDANGYGCHVGGEVEDFQPAAFLDSKIVRQTDRSTQMGMAACDLAVEDAELNLSEVDTTRLGMYFANVFGGMQFAEPELFAQSFLSPSQVSAYQSIAWFYAATQGQWSIAKKVKGYAKSIVGDRAGGLQALILGALAIRQGHCDQVLSGGFEAPLAPYVYAIHEAGGQLASSDDHSAYRPLDRRACGMVLGEGAGVLLLESLESARNRNAPIYAELAGGAMNISAPNEEDHNSSVGLTSCVSTALIDANMQTSDVAHILPDGSGVPQADIREVHAFQRIFGDLAAGPTISVPKAAFGHTLAAAGPLDAILAAMMLREGMVPTAWAPEQPIENVPPQLANSDDGTLRSEAILCVGSGWQGLNAAVVLRRLEQSQ
jgi:minimal PKS chain-length factor (CLF/KS beta)